MQCGGFVHREAVHSVRVVGYIREAPGQQDGETAYAQAERIRRWVGENGHQLIAVCQDLRTPGHHLGRDGFRALLGILTAGEAEAVVITSLDVLSADKVQQEIMLWDLHSRGVAVASTTDADTPDLEDPPADKTRMLVRDVLYRADEYRAEMTSGVSGAPTVVSVEEISDVIVELIPPERSLGLAGEPGGQGN